MLNPAAETLSRTHAKRVTRLGPGVALRVILFFVASIYVLGPTLAQWVSFDAVRDEVAALREAEPPKTTLVENPEAPSPELVAFMEDVVPEDARGLVAPGLSAIGTIHDGAGDLGSAVLATGVRALQIAVAMMAVIAISMRSTMRYRPRHSRGAMAVLFGRRG